MTLIKFFNFFSFSAILQVEYLREYSTKIKDIFAGCGLYKVLLNRSHCILAAFILSEIFWAQKSKKVVDDDGANCALPTSTAPSLPQTAPSLPQTAPSLPQTALSRLSQLFFIFCHLAGKISPRVFNYDLRYFR